MRSAGLAGIFAVALAVMSGLLVGVSGYTFWYADGASYMYDDPAVCVNCHIMRPQYEGWQKASHHAVATCNDCHVPHDPVGKYLSKASNGYHHSRAFTLQDFHEPIRITPHNKAILLDNCVRCHQEAVSMMMMPGAGHGPPSLTAGAGGIDCVSCHRSVGHGP